MTLQYKFFRIPVQSAAAWEDEVNRFLRSVRVVHVQRDFVAQGENSFWALAVEYMPADGRSPGGNDSRRREKVDFKAILSPEDFAVFARLREWRKEVAAEEGVPVYAIFTNEQLAKIAELRPVKAADVAAIDGIGASRIDKYAQTVVDMVSSTENATKPDETEP